MFYDFEKNLGLKIVTLNEYEDKDDPALNDPKLDLQVFDKVIQNTFDGFRSRH